jgi:hypothetical protein
VEHLELSNAGRPACYCTWPSRETMGRDGLSTASADHGLIEPVLLTRTGRWQSTASAAPRLVDRVLPRC